MRATPQSLFAWHCRPGALERLTPPWETLEVESQGKEIRSGSRVVLRLARGPFRIRWIAEHTRVVPDVGFEDVQVEGPFKAWRHWHGFEPDDSGGCLLRDRIEYELPFGALGKVLGRGFVRRSLARTFAYRHRTTALDMEFHQRYATGETLKVAITGATGLVGSALQALLTTGGHRVLRLIRSSSAATSDQDVAWDPARGVIEPEKMEGLDALVHLAGESIAGGRWTAARKDRIRRSRVEGTRNLVRSLETLEHPPKTFLSASAVGFYGDRGDELLDERSARGSGFLADVVEDWEQAARASEALGMRVALARFGVVLTPRGGALAKMLPAFRLGGGGRIGSGRQFMSWISIDDAVRGLVHILMRPKLTGPVNLVSPQPVRNQDFTRELGRALRRPTVMTMPAVAARILFGEMAEETLLASQCVAPKELQESGYDFCDENLAEALQRLLGRV